VVWVGLDPTLGHEQARRRPALVVSFEPFHSSGLLTVLPITSARTVARYPGDVPIPAGTAGLPRAGVVICQPRTVSIRRLLRSSDSGTDVVGYLDNQALRRQVRDAVAHHFALDIRPIRDGSGGAAYYRG
jgi:mRNA-degrading endonuclease toxin of MazEF toxin-antitoxin module